jgi:hypothetical protein
MHVTWSAVIKVTRLRFELPVNRGVIFLFPQRPDRLRVPLDSYPMNNGELFPRGSSVLWHVKLSTYSYLTANLRTGGALSPFLIRLQKVVLN